MAEMLGARRLTAGTVPGGEPTALPGRGARPHSLRGSGWLGARWHRLGARLGPGTQSAPCSVVCGVGSQDQ